MSKDEEFIRCEIAWVDEPDAEPETVIFAEHGTEGTPVDGLVFFTGYTADELRDAVGIPGDLGEGFTIVSVVGAAADIRDLGRTRLSRGDPRGNCVACAEDAGASLAWNRREDDGIG